MRIRSTLHIGAALGVLLCPVVSDASDPRELYAAGIEAFECGDVAVSLRAFDGFIKAKPDEMPFLWQRGIGLYYAERWDDCVAQFESHRRVNADDAENSVWHYLCVAARDSADTARNGLFPADDARIPMMAIHRLFAGEATTKDVFAAVDASRPDARQRRVRTFYAHLYIALWYESRGNTDKTRFHLEKSLEGPGIGHYMETVARVHLARLTGVGLCR